MEEFKLLFLSLIISAGWESCFVRNAPFRLKTFRKLEHFLRIINKNPGFEISRPSIYYNCITIENFLFTVNPIEIDNLFMDEKTYYTIKYNEKLHREFT